MIRVRARAHVLLSQGGLGSGLDTVCMHAHAHAVAHAQLNPCTCTENVGPAHSRAVQVARAFFQAATKLSDDNEDILPQV